MQEEINAHEWFEAVKSNNLEKIKEFTGIDIDALRKVGISPKFVPTAESEEVMAISLIIAAYNGFEDIVKYFVELGADVNTTNDEGGTPLMAAAECGNENLIKYLIEHLK